MNQHYQTIYVADLDESLRLVYDSYDVAEINQQYQQDFDAYFAQVGQGEYTALFGFYGGVPYLSKEVFEVTV